MPSSLGAERSSPRYWLPQALAIAGIAVALAVFLQNHNARTLISWHGFLHTAIANRFPGSFSAPDNPFFAGETLPYYWFYHYVAASIGASLGLHPIHAFQILTAAGLACFCVGAAAIGVYRLGTLRTGLLVGFIGLAGINPLGPVIALRKAIFDPQPMFRPASPADLAETRFVSEAESGRLITHPLLGGLYVTADWRRGQNIPWYLDNSSRGVALGLIFPLLFLYLSSNPGWPHRIAAVLLTAVLTAFSPLLGLGLTGALVAGTFTAGLLFRNTAGAAIAAAAVAGAAIAAPTYYHLFTAGGSGMTALGLGSIVNRAVGVGFNVIVLLPLAVWGSIRAARTVQQHCTALVVGGSLLLAAVPVLLLPDGTEHNLANTGYLLLAVPAMAWTGGMQISSRRALCIIAIFLPTAVATVVSFTGRPALPVAIEGTSMHRTADPSVEQLYRWIRGSTSPEAVFVVDPARPLKMSGNVAELPAFTARSLFVDTPTYVTTPHRDFAQRVALARKLLSGETPATAEAEYLRSFGRPLYLLSYQADQPMVMARLTAVYGEPRFHNDFIAAYVLGGYSTE